MNLSISSREDLNAVLEANLHGGNAPVALALSDLDGFADINRDHGHDAGDDVLVLWEQTFLGNVPSDATVLRLGGDEYVAILPSLSVENALIVLDEIRGHFATYVSETLGVTCSASIGVAANPHTARPPRPSSRRPVRPSCAPSVTAAIALQFMSRRRWC